jgi:hypothetical protein
MNFNDLQFLDNLSYFAQVAVVVFTILAATIQATKVFYLDPRVKELTNKEKNESQLTFSAFQSTITKRMDQIEAKQSQKSNPKPAKTKQDQIASPPITTQESEAAQQKIRELEAKLRPRTIPSDKIDELRLELSKLKGDSILITSVWGDQEAFSFATELKALFRSAGWIVDGVNQAMYTNPIKGVVIIVKNEAVTPKANFIFQFLNVLGVHSHGEIDPHNKFQLGLIIGAKE